jgi:hypothetical protein
MNQTKRDQYFNYQHVPTGFYCHVMAINGEMAFCDFGDKREPFCNVRLTELIKLV